MKKRMVLMLCTLLLCVTMIGKVDSQAAAGVPGGYSKYASYEGYDFYRNANSDTVCFNSQGNQVINEFKCDGTYTYFFQADGTAMRDRLTYHPDGAHVIYFDSEGHEVFSDFAHVKKSIAGTPVDDYCFFDVYGYMYVDVLTYDKTGTYLYYANPYGVMEVGKWFQFSSQVKWADGTSAAGIANKYGYATENGTLMTNQWTYNWNGQMVYLQGNGTVATGTIFDEDYYYVLDDYDGHLVNTIPIPNEASQYVDPTPSNYSYGVDCEMTKAYFENGLLKVDIYVINNRSVNVSKFDDLTLVIYDKDYNVIANQTFYDVPLGMSPYSYKLITLTFDPSCVFNPNYKLKNGIKYKTTGSYLYSY